MSPECPTLRGEGGEEGVPTPEEAQEGRRQQPPQQQVGGSQGWEGQCAGTSEAEGHLRRAHVHMSAGKHELAVSELSSGLKCCATRPLEFALLLKRSEAFSAICKQLREIPPAESERRAIYAPDPCHLAGMGFKDAMGALSIRGDSAEALLCKGQALLQLEKYGEAQEAATQGLQLLRAAREGPEERLGGEDSGEEGGAPGAAGGAPALEEALQGLLAECRAALGGSVTEGTEDTEEAAEAKPREGPALEMEDCSRKRQRLLARTDDSDCILCMKLLFEPVTTPCGHTFCKPCFARALDHGNKCPMCRTVLHVGRELPVTVVLKALLEKSFPEEYEARRQEESFGAGAGAGQEATILPLFVMSPILPGEKMALNIFEPRYRLMVRRCMEGSHRFGMATVDARHQLHSVACECEITECQPLPDGRFYIEIVGRRRFRPLDATEQDGYRVARAEYLSDSEAPAPGTPERTELDAVAAEVEVLADSWVERMQALAQARRGVAELLQRAGDKPPAADRERLSFWVANLACPLLDESTTKLRFLTTTSTLERLRACRDLLSHDRDANQGCCLM